MTRMVAPLGKGPIKILDAPGRSTLYYPDSQGRFECLDQHIDQLREMGCKPAPPREAQR